jgi:chromosome segregation ATPase
VSCRSLERQKEAAEKAGDRRKVIEFSRVPQSKLGWRAAAMERRGIKTNRGDQIRQVRAENQERKAALIEIDAARQAAHERTDRLTGLFQQAEKELRERIVGKPTKRVVQQVVANWRRQAEQQPPNRVTVRLQWQNDRYAEAPKEWRRLKRELPELGHVAALP